MLLSVITICLNAEDYIERCLSSIINQMDVDFEYIVVDGGSTDRTVSIIQKYIENISVFVSESDDGISDAMNKAISLSSGKYILFVHADDYLVSSEILNKVVLCLDRKAPIIIFNLQKIENGVVAEYKPRGFNYWMNFKTGIFHQGSICKRELFTDIGYFNTTLRVAMDYEFFLRAYRSGVKYKYFEFSICVMSDTGVSSKLDKQSLLSRFSEERITHEMHTNSFCLKSIYKLYWPMYLMYRNARISIKKLKDV